jgi:uncharacterized protein (DUF1800 family)
MELRTDRDKVAHLLRRFGLGASQAEVDFYSKNGLRGAIDALLNYDQVDEGFDVPIVNFRDVKGRVNIVHVQSWWVARMLITRRPLQEKMTLFWHNHFATSASKVPQANLMYQQNETLRQNATGRFQAILTAVSKDPAMLLWLDNQYNVKGKANENFAREVMELFTLGIGHYSEKDIQESARAFTGWSMKRVPDETTPFGPKVKPIVFNFRPFQHDDGEKEFLGNKGTFDGDDIVGILCGNPQSSRFLVKKMWSWFVYPDPAPALIEKLAADFHGNGMDVKRLIRNIMESDEFYSDQAYRHEFKNPVDFVIAPMRQLGIGAQISEAVKGTEEIPPVIRGILGAAQRSLKDMGMSLFFPPDVSGWDGGPAWVTSATMIERVQFGSTLFGDHAATTRRANIRYAAYALLQDQPTVEAAVTKLISLFDVELPVEKRRELVHVAMEQSRGTIAEDNANSVAATVCRLMFGTPEFQFC